MAGGLVDEVLERHVARGALVLNRRCGRGVVDGLAADAGLPVRIASGVGHDACTPGRADGNVLAFGGLEIVMATIAMAGKGKGRLLRAQSAGGAIMTETHTTVESKTHIGARKAFISPGDRHGPRIEHI